MPTMLSGRLSTWASYIASFFVSDLLRWVDADARRPVVELCVPSIHFNFFFLESFTYLQENGTH